MGKRLNVLQISQKKYHLVEGLSQELKEAIGEIEDSFTAIIYGKSGNGKTNFLVKLLKELKPVGDMLYISYEEAHGKTIQDLVNRHNLKDELPNLKFSDGETFEDLMAYLKKKRSPKIIVIDSWQFSNLTLENYKELKKAFVFGKTANKRKIILIISHVQGSLPDGKAAQDIKKDCNIKIKVEGFVAIVDTSRYGSKKNMIIWEERAKQYWGKKYKKLVAYKDGLSKEEKPKNAPITKPQKTVVKVLPPITEDEQMQAAITKLKQQVL
jgi:hypothetical protein